MEIPCEHCQTQLPLASLSFCRDCCVSFCSACCFENHSASGENGRLQFHDMSKWSESNQKEAACLILAHLNDHMEEVKTEGEAQVVQCGQRIDRLKELLQKQIRIELENRLSHLQGSVRTIRDAFNITDIDCIHLSTSRRSFEAEARFVHEKLVDSGLKIDLHAETNRVMLAIGQISDLAAAVCLSDDPFSATVENSVLVEDDTNVTCTETLSTSAGSDDFAVDPQDGDHAQATARSFDLAMAELDDQLAQSPSHLSLSLNSQVTATPSLHSAASSLSPISKTVEVAAFNSDARIFLDIRRGRLATDILEAYIKQSAALLTPELANNSQPQVLYQFSPSGNEFLPVKATALIQAAPFGSGYGLTEPQAQYEAARKTLESLVPGVPFLRERHEDHFPSVSIDVLMSLVRIPITASYYSTLLPEHQQLLVLSVKPDRLLTEFLRDYVARTGDIAYEQRVKNLSATSYLYYMKVAGVEATIRCGDLLEGRNQAIQRILSKLHPDARTWAELVRRFFIRQPNICDVHHDICLPAASSSGGVVGTPAITATPAKTATPSPYNSLKSDSSSGRNPAIVSPNHPTNPSIVPRKPIKSESNRLNSVEELLEDMFGGDDTDDDNGCFNSG